MDPVFRDLKPITRAFGFIEGNAEELGIIADTLVDWQNPLVKEFKNRFVKKSLPHYSLESTLLELCPLTNCEIRKFLLIPTESQWVAFFDNLHMGTDTTGLVNICRLLKKQTIHFHTIPESTTFEIFAYSEKIGSFDTVRSISAVKESKWDFDLYGEPLPFERLEYYKAKQIKKRFNFDILVEYLGHLGIRAFREDFYKPDKGSVLIEKIGPKFEATKEFTLQQAKDFWKGIL